jgi:hypothetical protein
MRPDPRPEARLRAWDRTLLPGLVLALLLGPALGAAHWIGDDDACDPPPYRTVVQLGAGQADLPAVAIAPAPPGPAGDLALDRAIPAEAAPCLPGHRPRGPPSDPTA